MATDGAVTPSEGSSSPLSVLPSRSPTPPSELEFIHYTTAHTTRPYDYPSPSVSSSDLSSLGSTPSPDTPSNIMDARTPPSTQDEDESPSQPPKKRRRITKGGEDDAKKERRRSSKKEDEDKESEDDGPLHLDFSEGHAFDAEDKEACDKLMKVLQKRRKIVVVAGAGISVSAGIPDFRSSTGLFKTLKREHNLKSSGKDLFDAAVYKDGDSTTSFHAMIRNLSTATKTAQPTPFHHLLATLAHEQRLLRLYTQNVDGIDTSLEPLKTEIPLPKKGPWPKTIQLHGTLEHMTCTKCHRISDFAPDLFDGPSPPACRHCEETDGIRTQHAGKRSHGIGVLRPRMVLYNEHNPDDEAIGSVVKADMRTRPDALIVVGTTLKVPGVKRIVKEMCGIVRDRRDGVTVWINNDPPPALKDYEWDIVVRGACDAVAREARFRKWDEPEPELRVVSDEDVEKVKMEKGTPSVVITSPTKKNKKIASVLLPTPQASPRMKPASTVAIPAPVAKTALNLGKGKKQATLPTKRKGTEDAKPTKKAPAKKAAPSKKKPVTAAANKNAKRPGAAPSGLKLNFNVGKPNVSIPAKTKKEPNTSTGSTGGRSMPIKAEHPLNLVSYADMLEQIPSSPSKPTVPFEKIAHADAAETLLKPVSPNHAYYNFNSSPPRPTFSPISTQKAPPYRGITKSYQDLEKVETTPTRGTVAGRKESPEERRRVVSPTSVPRGMHDLLQMPSE